MCLPDGAPSDRDNGLSRYLPFCAAGMSPQTQLGHCERVKQAFLHLPSGPSLALWHWIWKGWDTRGSAGGNKPLIP